MQSQSLDHWPLRITPDGYNAWIYVNGMPDRKQAYSLKLLTHHCGRITGLFGKV
jgi:hypothetical protein